MTRKSSRRRTVSRPARRPAARGARAGDGGDLQFALVHEAQGVVTWVWEPARNKLSWFGDAARLLGLRPGTFDGGFQDYLRHVHPDDVAKARRIFRDCLKGACRTYRHEERVIWPDRSVHWLETYGRAERGADGRTVKMSGVVRDITEKKESEQALASTQALLERALDAIPEATAISRLCDGRYLRVNVAVERLLGYRAGEMLGRSSLELGIWADRDEREQMRAELARMGSVLDRPATLVGKDGGVHKGLISASRIEVGGEACAIFIFRDLTAQVKAEERLLQSETKYGAVFAAAADAIVVARRDDGVMQEVNDAWVRLTGFSRERGVGRSAIEIGLWKNPADRVQVIEKLASHGRVEGFPARFTRADGTPIDVLLSGVTVEIESVPCIVWSWRDVTELHRIGREAEESRARLRALFDAAPDPIIIRSPRGVILEVNAAACRATGYTDVDLIGKPVSAFIESENLEGPPLVDVAELAARGAVVTERIVRRKDGSKAHVEVHATLLPDGNIQTVSRDVTSQKLNEELVAHIARGVSASTGAEFFRSLCQQLAEALGADLVFIGEVADPGGERVRTLSVYADGTEAPNFDYPLAGSPCVQAISRRGTICISEGAADRYPQDIGLKRRGVSGYVGTSLHASDGTGHGILVATSRRALSRPQLWISVLEIFGARAAAEIERGRAEARLRELNVSLERRVRDRTEELEAANRELESFTYSVSHDLRAPLRAIIGYIDILREEGVGSLTPDLRKHFARIETNASRMRELIEDLLALSRVGREALKLEPVDMSVTVNLVLDELGGRKPPIELVLGDLPAARADASLIRQVWTNLISNAMKFSSKVPHPRIEICGRKADGRVEYSVGDNGAGFDMRYADNLFKLFRRLHNVSEFEGTGAGLAIVRRIVERHGGEVSARGEPEQGATFRFTLPA